MKFNIYITFSKLMALLVLGVGTAFAIITKSSEVIIFSMSLAAGLAGLKSWNTTREKLNGVKEDQK